MIYQEENDYLCAKVSKEELKDISFSFQKDKIPSLDNLLMDFFKVYISGQNNTLLEVFQNQSIQPFWVPSQSNQWHQTIWFLYGTGKFDVEPISFH